MAVKTRGEIGSSPGTARESQTDVRAWLAGLVLLAVAIPVLSSLLGLYDRVLDWGKVVHGVEGFLVALLLGILLIGWRDLEAVDLRDQLAALMTMFSGLLFGVMWEIVEFVLDWVRYSDLQKSNSDTMTDFLWNDVGAIVGTLVGLWLYCHRLSARQREDTGQVAQWLVDGPSRVLDRHGFPISIVVAVLAAGAVAALWFAGRPLPGLAIP
jgi:hypothetical protein